MVFSSERNFTLYDYRNSHSQLVLRSSKDDFYKTNIDVIFFDVKHIISEITFKHLKINCLKKNSDKRTQFEIEGGISNTIITSAFFQVLENKFDFHESSIFQPINDENRIIFKYP